MTSKPTTRWAALGLSVALVGTACGSGGDTTTSAGVPELDDVTAAEASAPPTEPPAAEATQPPETETEASPEAPSATVEADAQPAEEPAEEAPAEPAGENQLPDVEVVDLATGDNVLLSSFAPADRPIVLWFWAPH